MNDKYETAIDRALKERDEKIEQLKDIIRAMMVYLPDSIVTCDVSTCKCCGGYVGSGCITYCEKCMRQIARDALKEM